MGTRKNVVAVHSLDHFALEVPDLEEARRFYEAFGLTVKDENGNLGLYAESSPHRWAVISKAAGPKRLRYISFGIFAQDAAAFEERIEQSGVKRIAPPAGAEPDGIWFEGVDRLPYNLRVAEKCSPDSKSVFAEPVGEAGKSNAIPNSQAPKVHPRRLSHFAMYTTDVLAAIKFTEDLLGVRLSDRSGDGVAFLHGAHGSDHHMIAFVKSDRRGMHHCSWDVGSIFEVGLGGAQMARAGYDRGWGLGLHVLGANYFYYVRDPWGSYSEYSANIDYIPHNVDWPAQDHPGEDSMFLWGPNPPEEFIRNQEPLEA